MNWVYDDGGRAAAGYKGEASDCVCRAVAIASEQPYQVVYEAMNGAAALERLTQGRRRSSARTGVWRATWKPWLVSHGWTWTPTMRIGQGCRVHLRAGELPGGRLVVVVSKHLVAVVDGVAHDTSDPTRNGTRCVYGYYVRSAT